LKNDIHLWRGLFPENWGRYPAIEIARKVTWLLVRKWLSSPNHPPDAGPSFPKTNPSRGVRNLVRHHSYLNICLDLTGQRNNESPRAPIRDHHPRVKDKQEKPKAKNNRNTQFLSRRIYYIAIYPVIPHHTP